MKLIFLQITFILLFLSNWSFAANRYWVGAGNWNSTANWSDASGGSPGFSVPGVSDIAVFDGGSISNCAMNVSINIVGFVISAPYSGQISLNPGIIATVATSGFSQAGGTFMGNDGKMSISGPFSLTGGIFTAPTGMLQFSGGFTNSAGIFNHNNGAVAFSNTQTITGNTTLYNLVFVANGSTYTIASGTIITSLNNVTINGSANYAVNTGIVEIKGDLTLTSSSNHPNNGGTATFLVNGTGTQYFSSPINTIQVGTNEKICALPNVEINKSSGSLNLIGLINLNGASFKTTAGAALVNPGTSTVNVMSNLTFSGENLILYNLHIFANAIQVTLNPATYTLTSTNNVTINGGSYLQINVGTIEILGNLDLINSSNSAFNGGSGTLLFDGTGVQTINSSASSAYVCALPNVIINKTAGALKIAGLINFGGSSWNTIAGASLVDAGTSEINILKSTTLSGQNLNLYDLTITGNFSFTNMSPGLIWTSTHLITLAGATSWYQINTGTLNAKGDVLVTNSNTSANVGGSAILLFNGTANQTLTGSGIAGGGKLPWVQINKTGGTLTLAGNIISLDQNWTYIAGNVDARTNATTVDCYKTSIIDGQGTTNTMSFYNLTCSGVIALAGNLIVSGDLTIGPMSTDKLDVGAANNYQINVGGNWTNNNAITPTSFNQQAGKVVFDGAGAQAVRLAPSTQAETFYNAEINNIGTGLTLNSPVTVSNNLNFITGKIFSTATNMLLLNNAATATGAGNSSFVSGPVQKTGNQAFVFPVGKNAVYAPIAISAPGVNTNQFSAEYFETDPDVLFNTSSKDATLNHLSRCEYWILNRTIGSSNVTVRLSWDTRSCAIPILTDVRVARWNGSQWKDHGNGGTTGNQTAGTIVSSGTVSAFSPFTLASTTIALPIELIDFTGHCENNLIVLNWSTATETNNLYFIMERSMDGINWEAIEQLAGAGNSIFIHDYTFLDKKTKSEISYYRLKQIDFDGNFYYSAIIKVQNCQENDAELLVFPNPANGSLHVQFSGATEQVRSIDIFNATGSRIYHTDTYLPTIDVSNISTGLCMIRLNLDAKILTQWFLNNNN